MNRTMTSSWDLDFCKLSRNCKNFYPCICDEHCEFEPINVYNSYLLIHKKPESKTEASILNICDQVEDDPRKIVSHFLSKNKGIEVYGILEIQPQMWEKTASQIRKNGLYVNRRNYMKDSFEKLTQGIGDLPDNYFAKIVCAENYNLKQ